ncbi:hypothetical protein NUW58_g5275 [Xylaria curta]|uniref:Uncharacterized protein n=1 Tax=Xylaria curta TaxID=42375 RepID=A0ACC1P4V7_9PEZI|nr:hypothetical protein NUW58_g5275 [Xylaria curta]
MHRQIWAGCRNPVRSLTSSLFRSTQPQQGLQCQRHFSQAEIQRQIARTKCYDRNGKGPRRLHAGIHGTIFTSIALLVLNDTLDFESRKLLGYKMVESIRWVEDVESRFSKFRQTGESLLAGYSGGPVEYHEGVVRNLGDGTDVKILTAPDPDVEGGTLPPRPVTLSDLDSTCISPSRGGNRFADTADALIPKLEGFASGLGYSPRVRGAMVVFTHTSDWVCVYWDGKRWINIVYLEWAHMTPRGKRVRPPA